MQPAAGALFQEGGGVGEVGVRELAQLGFISLVVGVVDGLKGEVAGLEHLLLRGGGVGQVQGVFAHDLALSPAYIGYVVGAGVFQRSAGAGEAGSGVGGGVQAPLQLADLEAVVVFLPETGGAGTTMFTVVGILLVSCAGMLLLMNSRKKKS